MEEQKIEFVGVLCDYTIKAQTILIQLQKEKRLFEVESSVWSEWISEENRYDQEAEKHDGKIKISAQEGFLITSIKWADEEN